MKWCSDGIGYETFLNYFTKHYKASGGRWGVIGKSALSGASQECAKSSKKYENVKKEMLAELNKLLSQEPSKQTA